MNNSLLYGFLLQKSGKNAGLTASDAAIALITPKNAVEIFVILCYNRISNHSVRSGGEGSLLGTPTASDKLRGRSALRKENTMAAFLTISVFGLLVCILGIVNMTGNISSLHWYHRQRVIEENRKPFGRLVGIGTIIIGLAMIVFGILFLISEQTRLDVWVIIGVAELIAGIVAGMAVSFYAMKKYNGGIF